MTREPTAIQRTLEILNHEKGELRAEIERLKADNAALTKFVGGEGKAEVERQTERADRAQAHWEEYRKEVERLQTLVDFLEETCPEVVIAARAALEPKP
jgi:chromosome segregation ATPase